MTKYIGKRLIFAVVTVFVVITVTFFLMNMVPGGPFTSDKLSPQAQELVLQKYGLDKPVYVQYGIYLKNLLRGDLGTSIINAGYSVNDIIADKFPVSLKLGLISILFSCIIGIPLGAISAFRQGGFFDHLTAALASFFSSLPGFVFAVAILYFFGMYLHCLPTSGLGSWQNYIMPVLASSVGPIAILIRVTRAAFLDSFEKDYIKFLKAKGMGYGNIVFKHGLRNSSIPVITVLGPQVAAIMTGNFIVETIFTIPGLGSYFVRCISQRDYPVIMGTTIFYTICIIVVLLLVDILYGIIDPRIKFDK